MVWNLLILQGMRSKRITVTVGAVFAVVMLHGWFTSTPPTAISEPEIASFSRFAETQKRIPSNNFFGAISKKITPLRSKESSLRPSLVVSEPVFAAFNLWMTRYLSQAPSDRVALVEEGMNLARSRREEMVDLIESDPQRALQLSITLAQQSFLPSQVQAELEQPISAKGDLEILAALPAPSETIPPVTRQVVMGQHRFEAFIYGRRVGEPTRRSIALNGIVLGNRMAVNENPSRLLESAEVAWLRSRNQLAPFELCQVSSQLTLSNDDEAVLELAGEIIPLCSTAHAERLNEEAIRTEASGGEEGGGGVVLGDPAPSVYTEGIKDLIIIRVDFSDLIGEPFSLNTGTNIVVGLNTFYRDMSYGKAGFTEVGYGSDLTPLFRMPRTAVYYGTNDASVLRTDARSAATTAGYRMANFNFDVICFGDVPGFKFAGLGYIGGPGAWIRGTSSLGVVAHELGHNYGLNHANYWDTAGKSITGSGTSVEYGDKFDTMGTASAGSKHFNARYKNYLNWLTSAEVTTASQSGTYRIYPHDDPASTGIRALKTSKNTTTNYWVEYRSRYGSNKWMTNGVGIRWAETKNQSSLLLDMTPGSPDSKDDSQLLFGRTFSDKTAGVHITPIGLSATVPVGVDIVINRGTFPTNIPPIARLEALATNGSVNSFFNFSVVASDANSDALAYSWDFGDGSIGSNTVTQKHAWTAAGDYVVQCTVTDMKGGTSMDSILVKVGNPTTYLISGRVWENGIPVPGIKVTVSSTKSILTDSSGRYYITGLPAGAYTVQAVQEGYSFARSGFSVPLSVGPSRLGMDFVVISEATSTTSILVAAGSVWQYLDNGSNLLSAWLGFDYDDAAWSEGPAPLGYGDDTEKTVVRFGTSANNKYVTTYFRRKFEVSNPSAILDLTLGLRRDDGGVVYLNGKEVFRSNMTTGSIGYTTLASSSAGGVEETTFYETSISPDLLISGTNLLAVEIHQNSRSSSDIAFDLRLEAVIAASVTPPELSAKVEDDGLVLIWPDTGLEWKMVTTITPDSPQSWIPLGVPALKDQGFRVLKLPLTNSFQFFKLNAP